MESTVWRPVAGWAGIYEVSNMGQLARVTRKGHIVQYGRKVLAGSPQSSGHIAVHLTYQGRRRRTHVHVLVAEAFLGERPTEVHMALHRNDVPSDNRVENLYWGTRSDNYVDAVRNGRI